MRKILFTCFRGWLHCFKHVELNWCLLKSFWRFVVNSGTGIVHTDLVHSKPRRCSAHNETTLKQITASLYSGVHFCIPPFAFQWKHRSHFQRLQFSWKLRGIIPHPHCLSYHWGCQFLFIGQMPPNEFIDSIKTCFMWLKPQSGCFFRCWRKYRKIYSEINQRGCPLAGKHQWTTYDVFFFTNFTVIHQHQNSLPSTMS